MPGILPMKVIKVGTNAQTRIAQACDRCRSKKIRCDGIRPCCSQCSSVGFECKTSDKLSRRAFPRGYTESLEERVRALEGEVRELKDLLDEKDEKIDMLSRLHSQSSQSTHFQPIRRSSLSPGLIADTGAVDISTAKEDTFTVQQSPYLDGEGATSYFAGTSSGKTFLDAFKQKIQETGRSTAYINANRLLMGSTHIETRDPLSDPVIWRAPPTLESDKMIAVYLQEWAPLFPVLHRPSFLELYQKYTAAPETIVDNCSHAQLNLVFGIAALSSGLRDSATVLSFEVQWQAALETILTEHSMPTLQCLILAQLYCIQRGDYQRLLTYKALATSLSSRLGLHQSQKRFALGRSTCEMRKKVFWTLYTVDCFSAVTLGLPKQLKDDDVHCEYPVDADEEYVDETGFKAPCPGEFTRLSSALALFRVTRILSRVLEEVYPALPSYELSLQKLSALSEELEQWQSSLAPHLRLTFAQDKPSTGTISSRSPILSLTYHYIRSLIHRPAVCASLGARASSSVIAMAGSCKHIVQIVELLSERGLSFSFCLNKDELLVLSGLGLLYQSLVLDANSKLFRDNQKMVTIVSTILNRSQAPCASEFGRVACSFFPIDSTQLRPRHPALSRHNSDSAMSAPQFFNLSSPEKSRLKAAAQRLLVKSPFETKDQRRATVPSIAIHQQALQTRSQPNLTSPLSPVMVHQPRSEPARSPEKSSVQPVFTRPSAPLPPKPVRSFSQRKFNLDYLSFSNGPTRAQSPDLTHSSRSIKHEPTDWERLLGSIDNGQTNIFDNIYGGLPVEVLKDDSRITLSCVPQHHNSETLVWDSHDVWITHGADTANHTSCTMSSAVHQPESVFSIGTDEETASGEEMFAHDWNSVSSMSGSDAYAGIMMPHVGGADDELLSGIWDSATAVL